MEFSETAPDVRSDLQQLIAENDGHIDFSTFMERSLYGPDGYYEAGHVVIGGEPGVHFSTSPHVSPLFGATTANFINRAWQEMGEPEHFDVVEMGAGEGRWANDILHAVRGGEHPHLEDKIDYTIVERSSALRQRQQEHLAGFEVSWASGDAFDPQIEPVHGMIISNELPDAFGVNRLVRRGGELCEIFTTVDDNGDFADVLGEPSPHNLEMPEARWVYEDVEKPVSPSTKTWMNTFRGYPRGGLCAYHRLRRLRPRLSTSHHQG